MNYANQLLDKNSADKNSADKNFGGQNFWRTKFFGGQNFRRQAKFSAILSADFCPIRYVNKGIRDEAMAEISTAFDVEKAVVAKKMISLINL